MTNAEHLIENAILAVRDGVGYENFSDINANYTGCTCIEAYEMAMHIVYSLYDGVFPEFPERK